MKEKKGKIFNTQPRSTKVIQIYKEIIKTINFLVLYLFWAILAYSVIMFFNFGKIKTGFSILIHDKDLPIIIKDLPREAK